LDRLLFQSRYTIPAMLSTCKGVPVDQPLYERFLVHRKSIQAEIVADCPVFLHQVFKQDRFATWLTERGILGRWPRTESGLLSTEDESFESFSHIPQVEQLRQIRQVVNKLRKPGLEVYGNRNHYSILPFQAESGRNATKGCIFQSPKWLRGVVQPAPGRGLVYADCGQEELAIAGVQASDSALLNAYNSGDLYTAYGVAAGLIPKGGTGDSHPHERATVKTLMIALLYGMSMQSLAVRLGVSRNRARDLLSMHKRMFTATWKMLDAQPEIARANGYAETALGWRLYTTRQTRTGTLRNFRIQGTGADILRLASIFLFEDGLEICAPIHDAVLIECAEEELQETGERVRAAMVRASQYVLDGFALRVKVQLLKYPDRLIEPAGAEVWSRIVGIVNRLDSINNVGMSVGPSVGPYVDPTYIKKREKEEEEETQRSFF